MNGILNILKPPGMTSFDVVGYLRGLIKIKRIGHTGTLDPAAVGVLPICIGNSTKVIEFLTETDKLYRAELTLGSETDTQDSTGKTIGTYPVNVSEEQIRDTFKQFIGKYNQIPPMYSAVKIDGKKLYELARSGITVERKPKPIEIYALDILDIKLTPINTILFDVKCSKGTYIRTLCDDIGKALGCGGHMSFLVRLSAGVFDISEAITLEEVSELVKNKTLQEKMISVDKVFKDFKKIILNSEESKKLTNGLSLEIEPDLLSEDKLIMVYNEKEEFFSIASTIKIQDKVLLKSKKLFI
jgi:tRNA pseudouridine55 synthase